MYKVIKLFTDLQDENHVYHVGDTFPHGGKHVSESRVKELSGSDNKRGEPLIQFVQDAPEKPSPVPEKAPAIENTGETPTADPKANEKPKKGQKNKGAKRNATADS